MLSVWQIRNLCPWKYSKQEVLWWSLTSDFPLRQQQHELFHSQCQSNEFFLYSHIGSALYTFGWLEMDVRCRYIYTEEKNCDNQVFNIDNTSCFNWNVTRVFVPDKWGILFRSYGRDHKMQCLLYTFAKGPANFPFPWALQMNPPWHTNH